LLLLLAEAMRDVAVSSETPVSGAHAAARALERALLHGGAWTAAAKWASQALSWISLLIVARVLTPEEGKERKDGA